MEPQKFLQQIIIIGLILLFLVGCSAPATPTPIPSTSTPIPPSPTPTPSGPKSGHWEGEPSVSFDVTTSSTIRNFTIIVPFGTVNTGCTIKYPDDIAIESDGTFLISESTILTDQLREKIDLAGRMGLPTPATTQTSSGETFEGKHIIGKFDSTAAAVAGTYLILTCETGLSIGATETSDWNAAWKGP